MRILVAGANGQVGHSLCQRLKEYPWEVIALTRNEFDITNVDIVNRTVEQYRPNIIINCAAYTAVDKAEQEQTLAFAINRDGPAYLASAANEVDAVIIHLSTDYVFDGNAHENYTEADPTNPQGIYGASKLEGEKALASANKKHIILRTAWVFGEHGNNFVKTMIRLGSNRDTLGIVADQEGGPTYAGDIANALITIVESISNNSEIPWGVYHYSGTPHTNWYEFSRRIFDEVEQASLYNKPVPTLNPITTADYPTPAKRPANSKLDCTKIEQAFGIKPSNWQAALKNIHTYTA